MFNNELDQKLFILNTNIGSSSYISGIYFDRINYEIIATYVYMRTTMNKNTIYIPIYLFICPLKDKIVLY